MDGTQKGSAYKLAAMLNKVGENHGILVIQGHLVIRDGVLVEDSPMMFEETDLLNAVELGIVQKNKVEGSVSWEWYVVKHVNDSWKKGLFTFTQEGVAGEGFLCNCKRERGDVTTTAPTIHSTWLLQRNEVENRFSEFVVQQK
jgi:hypothetical protein